MKKFLNTPLISFIACVGLIMKLSGLQGLVNTHKKLDLKAGKSSAWCFAPDC